MKNILKPYTIDSTTINIDNIKSFNELETHYADYAHSLAEIRAVNNANELNISALIRYEDRVVTAENFFVNEAANVSDMALIKKVVLDISKPCQEILKESSRLFESHAYVTSTTPEIKQAHIAASKA